MEWLGGLGATAAVVVIAVLCWRWWRRFQAAAEVRRAREAFPLQRDSLKDKYLCAAALLGKPRGLLWKDAQWEQAVEFVREKRTRKLLVLVGVAIQFEAVAGGDMEDVAAVGDLKNATAVFFYHKGHWVTVGETHFNLNPDELVARKREMYELLVFV